jgi:serine phosphatase RsbU (regulator of sigma subunit)
MASRFVSPLALVEALHNREAGARGQLRDLVGGAVRRLVQELQARHNLPHRPEHLLNNALHSAETYLRMRPAHDFETMSEAAFRGAILFQVARQMMQPFGGRDQTTAMPEPLPETETFTCQTVYRPLEKVGSFWYGGDWYGGRREADGTLWVIIADITGHGFAASLLANALPAVWRKIWADHLAPSPRPADVLAAMHDLLIDCLPEDVYVECTLLRMTPGGEVTIAPAGGSRLFLLRGSLSALDLLKLRGLWLGLDRPADLDQQTFILEAGDELLLGSDGIFDQLIEYGGRDSDLVQVVFEAMTQGGLLDAVNDILDRALRQYPQKDDITIVSVRRRMTR